MPCSLFRFFNGESHFSHGIYLATDNGIMVLLMKKISASGKLFRIFFWLELKIGGAKYPTIYMLLVYTLCTHLELSAAFFIFFKQLKQ